MRKVLFACCVLLLTLPLAGCTGDRDRGINKDRDKPRAATTEKPG
jgi:hypothetical protein